MGYLITSLNIYFWGKRKGKLGFVVFSQMGDSENTFLLKQWILMLKWLTYLDFFFKES
jgi:hypothetical protein